jgi:hypothetical protein
VNASAAERNWSVYRQIQTKSRNQLGHATWDKLVYLHEALQLRDIMQDPSYKAPVADWEASESSGSSTDPKGYVDYYYFLFLFF